MPIQSKAMKAQISVVLMTALRNWSPDDPEAAIRSFDVTEPAPNKIQIHFSTNRGPRFFEVAVKESVT